MKVLRFVLWDFWVKIVLWLLLFPFMLIFKFAQRGSRAGTKQALDQKQSEP